MPWIRSHLTAAKRLLVTCKEKYPCDNQWMEGQRQEKSKWKRMLNWVGDALALSAPHSPA